MEGCPQSEQSENHGSKSHRVASFRWTVQKIDRLTQALAELSDAHTAWPLLILAQIMELKRVNTTSKTPMRIALASSVFFRTAISAITTISAITAISTISIIGAPQSVYAKKGTSAEIGYPFSPAAYSETTRQTYETFLDQLQLHLASQVSNNLGYLWSQTQNLSLSSTSAAQNLNKKFEAARCKEFYTRLYNQSLTRFRLVYGYYESFANGEVTLGDRTELKLIANKLKKSCPSATAFACDFTVVSQSEFPLYFRLRKQIVGANGEFRNVEIELVSSSATESDRENRMGSNINSPSASQVKASQFSEAHFLNGFNEAQVLIYLGHARAGGGPSFYPPVLRRNKDADDPVDYGHYANQTSFKKMVSALQSSSSPPQVIGLFACKSAPLFAGITSTATPPGGSGSSLSSQFQKAIEKSESLFLGSSSLTTSNTDLGNTLGLIDSLLGLRCGAGLSQSVSLQKAGSQTLMFGKRP